MGAWGPGPFDNDAALDWSADLLHAQTWAGVESALRATFERPGPDGDDPEASVAAAATVALATAAGSDLPVSVPGEVRDFLGRQSALLVHDLVRLAAESVKRVLSPDGDLSQRWEGRQFQSWHDSTTRLLAILRQ